MIAILDAAAAHLWQSTTFLAMAALLAFALRRHRAAVRYRIWMAASLKFLIPFAPLVSFGARFSWRTVAAGFTPPPLVFPETTGAITYALPTAPHAQPLGFIVPALWSLGFAAVLLRWGFRWLRLRCVIRAAESLSLDAPVRCVCTPHALEPGVFGIVRPVIAIPSAIRRRLTPAELDSVIAHEMAHIRRCDNLTAALHMLVEALFWFHPLVWWLGARLTEERELACDEGVVLAGAAPQSYAEAILKVCRVCLESPLPCVAGIGGADLNRRIERIMTRTARSLGLGHKLLLGAVALLSLAAPFAIGVLNAPPVMAQPAASGSLAFEAASIKPSKPDNGNHLSRFLPGGKFTAENFPAKALIRTAFHLEDYQVSGGPSWADNDGFDINARPEGSATRDQSRLMLQTLLAQRFHLEFHRESREMAIYALTVSKGGFKLHPALQDRVGDGDFRAGAGHLAGQGATLPDIAGMFGVLRGRPVIDMTGIVGKFDCELMWTPDQFRRGEPGAGTGAALPHEGHPAIDPDGPDFFAAVEGQFGLKLDSRKGPVPILVIDRLEKPTEN